MGARLERYELERRKSNIRKLKSIFILLLITSLFLGLNYVNKTIIDLDCLDNANIFKLDIKAGSIDLFGKSYQKNFFLEKDH